MTPPSLDSEFTVKDKPTPALPILFTRARRLLGSGLQTCWNRLHRNRFAALRYGFLFMVLWSWLLYIVVAFLIPPTPVLIPPSLLYAKRPLLVVAHPDDESLFFGPTLLSLARREGTSLNILVLSSGNNYGLGSTRKQELIQSCSVIGAKECIVLDQRDIQDNPHQWWDEKTILPVIEQWVSKLKADAIITFDAGGISGHINHRAVSAAISHRASSSPPSSFPPTFLLRTVPTFLPPRKYIGVFDLPLTSFRFTFRILRAIFLPSSREPPPLASRQLLPSMNMLTTDALKERWKAFDDRGLIVSDWATWRRNVKAFWEHGSQNSWDRHLYVLVSRYMWFNVVVRVQ